MSRITNTFAQLKTENRKALSPYITAGDPRPEVTVAMLHALVKAGADILELGIPFSDPMAEGPVIQMAMERALIHNVSILNVLEMVTTFRQKDNTTPIVLMGYLNPIEAMGYQQFATLASKAGIDGIIIVDLPPEEAHDCHSVLSDNNIDLIFLHSPTTSDARFRKICELASGYLYYVSLKGVTGAGNLDVDSVAHIVSKRRKITDLPMVVGFGIKSPEDAAKIAAISDGVVVGAALINRIAEQQQNDTATIIEYAPKLIAEMRASMDTEIC